MEFKGFPKIARLNRDIVVSEKIDGSNAQVYIAHRAELPEDFTGFIASQDDYFMFAGSRTRWIVPGDDNFGFAKWVSENVDELFKLGPGQHFGEWWGQGIQRGYGLTEKRFSLFNTARWGFLESVTPEQNPLAGVVGVVPTLYQGPFSSEAVSNCIIGLKNGGSAAAPGWMKPEGVVVFHTAANQLFKVTVDGDEAEGLKGVRDDQLVLQELLLRH